MKQSENSHTEQGSFKEIQLGDILNSKEISEVTKLFKSKKLKEAKQYLNEPQLKQRLEDKGVVADYLYYLLELNLG